ncbi:MAG: hypothetical protein MUE59_13230 [Thiobacillaceae bacterium]|jgi:hypothetical protein|nr:hypothetical protein [Thiobacillaceae bacterium]
MKSTVILAATLGVLGAATHAESNPTTPAQWLQQMSDFNGNTRPVRTPEDFISFMNAVSDPDFHQRRFGNLSEPAFWGRASDTMFSAGFIENVSSLAQPQVAAAWGQAIFDPRFYEAMGVVLCDRNKWMRWSMAGLQRESYLPFAKPFGPAQHTRWQNELQLPAKWAAIIDPLQPSPLRQPAR